jgi:hypothetical protein
VTSPHLTPISDELRMAIGDSAIMAAQLEFHVAHLVAVARGEDDKWLGKTLAATGGALRQLGKLAADVDDAALRADLDRLVEDVHAALAERNRAIHSIAVTDVNDAGDLVAIFWHPKSGSEGPVDPDLLNAQVRRMGALGARTISHEHAAAAWRQSRRLDPAADTSGQKSG